MEITSLGFQFLLMERHRQLWTYLLKSAATLRA